ncbi:nucleotidyltransferase family protein [Halobellus rarus]|uniref:NTP transferase domain-containing protein n=1 Tax=Halobellus rarus TaxID=1126237 RepID=A0ABD6CMY5_9EURY|nr:nucleotidyltransferase family protein [Halobellus rarus]
MTDGEVDLPVVSPPFDEEGADEEGSSEEDDDRTRDRSRVAGVLLAAGTSDRFGDRNKLLATHDGDPLVRHAARTLLDAGLDPVVAVVGHEADRVVDALAGLDVAVVANDAYDTGQASSLRAGIGALRDSDAQVDAAVIALGDMPFVDPETVETLVAAYDAGVGDALAAAHDGVRGNPVLFDRRFFDALADVAGDVGGREILLTSGDSACVSVSDPGVRRDVDEPGDLAESEGEPDETERRPNDDSERNENR